MQLSLDISRGIKPLNIVQGMYVLKTAYPVFTPGAVHIFAMQGSQAVNKHSAFQCGKGITS